MYYLFGAGSNCYSVIGFIGKERIKGIIDNNVFKIGKKYCECPVIGFEQFLKEYEGELVIISTFACYEEVRDQLEQNGISKYLVYPRLQTSYLPAKQIIESWNLHQYKSICFFSDKVISRVISDYLFEKHESVTDIYNVYDYEEQERLAILKKSEIIIIMTDNLDNNDTELLEEFPNVLWVNNEIKDMLQKQYNCLAQFQNIHMNEICFLIGNGPSLKKSDLEKLAKNHICTFGCNRIFEIYSDTEWRPNYYVAADGMIPNEYMNEIKNQHILTFMKHFIGLKNSGIIHTYRYQEHDYDEVLPRFSEDITKCVYRSATILYDMIQIAAYMGFKEIYLLGVDCNYIPGSVNNYFNKSAEPDTITHRTDNMILAYQSAQKYAAAHDIKIYNATRGGMLEVFERVDFDSLFEK